MACMNTYTLFSCKLQAISGQSDHCLLLDYQYEWSYFDHISVVSRRSTEPQEHKLSSPLSFHHSALYLLGGRRCTGRNRLANTSVFLFPEVSSKECSRLN